MYLKAKARESLHRLAGTVPTEQGSALGQLSPARQANGLLIGHCPAASGVHWPAPNPVYYKRRAALVRRQHQFIAGGSTTGEWGGSYWRGSGTTVADLGTLGRHGAEAGSLPQEVTSRGNLDLGSGSCTPVMTFLLSFYSLWGEKAQFLRACCVPRTGSLHIILFHLHNKSCEVGISCILHFSASSQLN